MERPDKVGLLRHHTSQFLVDGVHMLGDLTTEFCLQSIEVLRQPLFSSVQSRLHIVPRGLLGPEGKDAQERGRQGCLLVVRKPCSTELLHGLHCLYGVRQGCPLEVLRGHGLQIILGALKGCGHGRSLSNKGTA
jgi:hypothetical protein